MYYSVSRKSVASFVRCTSIVILGHFCVVGDQIICCFDLKNSFLRNIEWSINVPWELKCKHKSNNKNKIFWSCWKLIPNYFLQSQDIIRLIFTLILDIVNMYETLNIKCIYFKWINACFNLHSAIFFHFLNRYHTKKNCAVLVTSNHGHSFMKILIAPNA